MKRPFVTVIISCRNEVYTVRDCVVSLLDANYPSERFEILIVDGVSNDGTKDVLADLEKQYKNFRWLTNENKTKPVALNIGIRESESDLVIICDAHAEYPRGFIGRNVDLMSETGADDVGGLTVTKSVGTVQADVVCNLFTNPFAIGNAKHRSSSAGSTVREVETVFGGCYRRDTILRVGPFNEKLTRTQDREYNIRLRMAGGRIMLDPKIKCGYYPRATLSAYLKWLFGASYWLQYAWRFTDEKMIRIRNYVPIVFVLWHFVVPLAFVIDPIAGVIATVPFLLYAMIAFWSGVSELIKGSRLPVALLMPLMLYLNHLVYGLGAIWGIVKGRAEGKDVFDLSSVKITKKQDDDTDRGTKKE